jgi:hypothetical protein
MLLGCVLDRESHTQSSHTRQPIPEHCFQWKNGVSRRMVAETAVLLVKQGAMVRISVINYICNLFEVCVQRISDNGAQASLADP